MPGGVAGFSQNPRAWELVSRTTETLNSLFDDLTRIFTYTEPDEVRRALRGVEAGPPGEAVMTRLRDEPKMRPEPEIRAAFEARGWRMALCDALLPLLYARCEPDPSTSGPRYRKGFGFAMVATGPLHASATLRILPVAELASMGIIEAMDVQLVRLRHLAPLELCNRNRVNMTSAAECCMRDSVGTFPASN